MLSQTIQRQVTVGDYVRILRKDGHEIAGSLVELSQDHLTLESSGKLATILMDMVGGWEVIQETVTPPNDLSDSESKASGQETEIDANSEQDGDFKDGTEVFSDNNLREALRVTLEVEAQFRSKLGEARLEPPQPDFDLSIEGLRGKQFLSALERIKSKYEYALKVNELGAKYGRIPPLIPELERLATQHFFSRAISRLLGYFHWLIGNGQKAEEMYHRAAQGSESANDWYSLAVITENEALACYAYQEVYSRAEVSAYSDAWPVFVSLLSKHRSGAAFVDLLSSIERVSSEEAGSFWLDASMFLLITVDNRDAAIQLASRSLGGEGRKKLLEEALRQLKNTEGEDSQEYRRISEAFGRKRELSLQPSKTLSQGQLDTFFSERNYGFIRGKDGKDYFFHRSAVSDEELQEKILRFGTRNQEMILVEFETAEGSKGPIAIGITLPRTPKEMFRRAVEYAESGTYAQAIVHIKKVLSQNPEYPDAAELHEKWREYARKEGIPRGKDPYTRAKRAQSIEEDFEKAIRFYQQAIQQGENVDNAVKDLAVLQAQQGNPLQSVKTLRQNRKRVSDRRSVDNMLINFSYEAGQYDEAIKLLKAQLHRSSSTGQRVRAKMQIASCYLQNEEYSISESHYRDVIELRPNTWSAYRNLALCVFRQKDYEQAEDLLEKVLDNSRDTQAEELLQAIRQERKGQRSNIEKIIEEDIATTLSSNPREISAFAGFFLDRCEFHGVPSDRVQKQEFNNSDVQRLVDFATKIGTRRPRERAEYYLSAVKMLRTMEDDDSDQIYRYLCRSLTSRADAAVLAGRLDAAKDLYAEALRVYAGVYAGSSGHEQDAFNALVRFLLSTLGADHIPMQPRLLRLTKHSKEFFSVTLIEAKRSRPSLTCFSAVSLPLPAY